MPHIELLISELPLEKAIRVEQDGMAAVVIRTQGGIRAYEDVCPHALWPLSGGPVKDGVLECDGHGWEFNIATGRCLNAPAYALTAVPLMLNGDTVRLEWTPKRGTSAPCASSTLCTL